MENKDNLDDLLDWWEDFFPLEDEPEQYFEDYTNTI